MLQTTDLDLALKGHYGATLVTKNRLALLSQPRHKNSKTVNNSCSVYCQYTHILILQAQQLFLLHLKLLLRHNAHISQLCQLFNLLQCIHTSTTATATIAFCRC